MDPTAAVSIASLIASTIAAWYAAMAWHRPRSAKRKPPPRFDGELPHDGQKLAKFLSVNEGKIVDIHVNFFWYRSNDAEKIKIEEKNYLMSYKFNHEQERFVLFLQDYGTLEDEPYFIHYYSIVGIDGENSMFSSDPAGGAYGILRGSFIPRSQGAGKIYLYGSLIQIDPLQRAKLEL